MASSESPNRLVINSITLIGLDIDMELGVHVGSLGAKNGDAYQGECKDRIQIEDQVLYF